MFEGKVGGERTLKQERVLKEKVGEKGSCRVGMVLEGKVGKERSFLEEKILEEKVSRERSC